MGNGNKFREKRTYKQGQMTVQVGFRRGNLTFRAFLPDAQPASLTYEQASDLGDLLDEALDEHDRNPLT